MVTIGDVAVAYVLSPGTAEPTGAGGLVGPNPVAHRMSTSPGLAATVVAPAKVPAFTAKLKSCRVATTWLPGHRKNAGLYKLAVVVADAEPAGVVTVTVTGPGPMSGASTLSWPGVM